MASTTPVSTPDQRRCGIPAVDGLWSGASAPPIAKDSDQTAVGAIQELLSGHGYSNLPGPLSPAYGLFGPATTAALNQFQTAKGLPVEAQADRATLAKLVSEPAVEPRAGRAYVSLALGFSSTPLLKVLALVAQMEGQGRFAAINGNTDRAGLSFGIIQWAQSQGRLAEILAALRSADADRFAAIFGDGDAALADGLLAHASKTRGGVDGAGNTTDPAFNLTAEPWLSRFQQAALWPAYQRAQVETALKAFTGSLNKVLAAAPGVRGERGVAFLLDVANQFGNAGAAHLCAAARREGMGERDLLQAVADSTVAAMPENLKNGVRARRDSFLNTRWLSDDPFPLPA